MGNNPWQDPNAPFWRVVYADGGSFYTRARSASEFIIDRVFFQFMIMCIFLYTSLLMSIDLPLLPQIVLFGAGVVSTFFLLAVMVTIYLAVIRLLKVTTIYTVVLLAPILVLNVFFLNSVLSLFEASTTGASGGSLEFWIRTLIVFVCLDVFHGKFVAPQHGLNVPRDVAEALRSGKTPPAPPQQSAAALPAAQTRQGLEGSAVASPPDPVPDIQHVPAAPPVEADRPDAPQAVSAPSPLLEIANKKFDFANVLFIKSEDHYLVVQETNQITMVRGKLRDVANRIDVAKGLQINRSVWVAFSAIANTDEAVTGRLELTLVDGTVFRVSQSRRKLFMHSYGRQSIQETG